jgi:ADP-heptose:LPS heptosyltransferase
MENILLTRLKSIGDIVLTLPAVHAVRENFPSAKIRMFLSIVQ